MVIAGQHTTAVAPCGRASGCGLKAQLQTLDLKTSSSGQSISHPSNAIGVMMAVSFAIGANARKTTVATGRRSTYAASPQRVSAAAIMSRCAMELCVKNTGYTAVQSTVAAATASFATRRASRQTPRSANAATNSMAIRVTAGVNPLNFPQRRATASPVEDERWIESCEEQMPVRRGRALLG